MLSKRNLNYSLKKEEIDRDDDSSIIKPIFFHEGNFENDRNSHKMSEKIITDSFDFFNNEESEGKKKNEPEKSKILIKIFSFKYFSLLNILI